MRMFKNRAEKRAEKNFSKRVSRYTVDAVLLVGNIRRFVDQNLHVPQVRGMD